MYDTSFNTIVISRSALANNFSVVKSCLARGVDLMAMVKADAYGHGMVESARAFQSAGCRIFGVAELREAIALREAGIDDEVFVTIGIASEAVGLLGEYRLTPVIYDLEVARNIGQVMQSQGRSVPVHIKVDTGMGRLGILPDQVPGFLSQLAGIQGITVVGMMSHFPASDDATAESTPRGIASFLQATTHLTDTEGCCRHIANSGGVINFAQAHCDMARSGIALYGYHPAGNMGTNNIGNGRLQPAMSFVSRVLQVKTLPPGRGISYGHTFTTSDETTIAILPVGYEDGFSRQFSNRGYVLIHGRKAPVRGRVCMNMCMVDVTEIDGVRAGDEVVLLGRQGEKTITADDLADMIGTISYEVLCNLGNSNQREYRE